MHDGKIWTYNLLRLQSSSSSVGILARTLCIKITSCDLIGSSDHVSTSARHVIILSCSCVSSPHIYLSKFLKVETFFLKVTLYEISVFFFLLLQWEGGKILLSCRSAGSDGDLTFSPKAPWQNRGVETWWFFNSLSQSRGTRLWITNVQMETVRLVAHAANVSTTSCTRWHQQQLAFK